MIKLTFPHSENDARFGLSLQSYLEQLHFLNTQILRLTRQIRELAKSESHHLNVRLLRSIPGVLVQNCAEMLGIELLYLPAYSPHLNLIERFWKFVKKQCLYSKYYKIFPEFKQAIEQCLEEANSRRQQKLESLLTWNFQSFKYVNNSPV